MKLKTFFFQNRNLFAVFFSAIVLLICGTLAVSHKKTIQEFEPPSTTSSFEFSFNSEGELHLSDDNPESNLKIKTELRGISTVDFNPGKSISIRWKPALQFTVNGRRLPEQEALLQAVGEQRMVLLISPNGTPEKIYYQPLPTLPASAAELVLNTGKMLLFQLAWDRNDLEKQKGLDFWGDHRRSWQKNDGEIHVTTTSVEKTQSGLRGMGKFILAFDSDGVLNSVEGTQTTSPDQEMQLGHSKTNYKFIKVHSEKADSQATLEGLIEDVPWIVVNSKAMMKATMEDRTKGWTLDRVVAEAENLIRNQKTSAQDLLALSTKIQELLWLNPGLSEELVGLTSSLGSKHPLFDEILKALTWVGDEKCQLALQKILEQNKSDESAAIRTMVGIAFVDNPTLESQRALEGIALNPENPVIGRTAELMLGQVAYQLLDSEVPRAEEIQSRYIRKLQDPEDKAEVRHTLNVIGNTGICNDYDSIAIYVGNRDPEIHSRALEALRFCRDSRVPGLLLSLFEKSDEEKQLALSIMEMRSQRDIFDPGIFAALKAWIQLAGSSHSLSKPVIGVLSQLARLDSRARSEFEEMRADCERIGICAYF